MTLHGFWAMASARLNELGFRADVIEAQLAHKEPDAVRLAYNRAEYMDEREPSCSPGLTTLTDCAMKPHREAYMLTSRVPTKTYDSVEAENISITIGAVPEDAQVTIQDTGWSEEEKDRMRLAGYDNMGMVRAWYS